MHHNIVEVKMIYNIYKLYSITFKYIYNKVIVKYITHNSCAIKVMPSFNRLWAQISAVIMTCLKS